MKRTNLTLIAAAVGLAFSAAVSAGTPMTKASYDESGKNIEAQYKTAKAACKSLKDNAQDICEAQAKGAQNVAHAELKADYKPSHESRYDARVVKADADYSVAREMCDDKAGNDKDVCVKEAKAALTRAQADAKAGEKTASARMDATKDKRDADYKVAAEKCEALAGDAKSACMKDAKARFGK